MKYCKRTFAIILVFLCCNSFYVLPYVNASSLTKVTTGGITLEGEHINTSESSKSIYLTVDSTGMEYDLVGYSARLQLTPCSSTKHGWIYGTVNPKIEVVTPNWIIGSSNFSGWNEKSYLDFTVEANDSIINSVSKESEVKIAITFPVTTPTSNWSGVEPYTDISVMNTLKRTDLKNNVNMPLSDLLSIELTRNKQVDIEKAKVTMSLSKNEVNKGNTFVVTIGIVGTSEPVLGLQGKLNYNKDIFECIEKNMVFKKWRLTSYNENTGMFLLEIADLQDPDPYVRDETSIVSFTFKVKDDANISGEEIIETLTISNLIVAGGVSLEEETVSKNVKIKLNSHIQSDQDEQNNSSDEDKVNNSTESTTSDGNSKNDSTTANTALPETGKSSIAIFFICLLCILLVYSYKKYKQY